MKKALLFSLISLFTVVSAVDSDIKQEEMNLEVVKSEEVGSKESLSSQEKITRYILPAMFPFATLSFADKPNKKALIIGALVKAGALLHPKTCSTALILTACDALGTVGVIGSLIVPALVQGYLNN